MPLYSIESGGEVKGTSKIIEMITSAGFEALGDELRPAKLKIIEMVERPNFVAVEFDPVNNEVEKEERRLNWAEPKT